MDFSDLNKAGNDTGAEGKEIPNKEGNTGDRGGVNDFDSTYKEMNSGSKALEYSKGAKKSDAPEDSKHKSKETTESAAKNQLADFDDMAKKSADSKTEPVDKPEAAKASDRTTDKSVDNALADFEDKPSKAASEKPAEAAKPAPAEKEKPAEAAKPAPAEKEKTTEPQEPAPAEKEKAAKPQEPIPPEKGNAAEHTVEKRDDAEKGAKLENVSYQQGQNDLGASETCGPTSIANALNRITGTADYNENDVLHNAIDHNQCTKSEDPSQIGLTSTENIVAIIDNVKGPESNIHTEVYEYDKCLNVEELADRLDDPDTVAIVGVDAATLWDKEGNVTNSGLFQHESDHWITVDSPVRDEDGNVTGFNIIDSGGGAVYVDRDKFVAMYQGNDRHTIADPTVILVSKSGEAANTFSSPEDSERAFNFKGSKLVLELGSKIDVKEKEGIFGRDNFSSESSFESRFKEDKRKELIGTNNATTCGYDTNLTGKYKNNDEFKISDEKLKELQNLRKGVPEITKDTVMQKVISAKLYEMYMKEKEPFTFVSGCISKAEDAAPYTKTIPQAREALRLDYPNSPYTDKDNDMYILRFKSEFCQTNEDIPKVDGNNTPPCTGTGFTGSAEHLIPEYTYEKFKASMEDAVIYRLDSDGNETLAAVWNGKNFVSAEVKH